MLGLYEYFSTQGFQALLAEPQACFFTMQGSLAPVLSVCAGVHSIFWTGNVATPVPCSEPFSGSLIALGLAWELTWPGYGFLEGRSGLLYGSFLCSSHTNGIYVTMLVECDPLKH